MAWWLGVYFNRLIDSEGPFPDKNSVWKRFRELSNAEPDLVLKIVEADSSPFVFGTATAEELEVPTKPLPMMFLGQSFPNRPVCPNCDYNPLKVDVQQCPRCGQRLDWSAEK